MILIYDHFQITLNNSYYLTLKLHPFVCPENAVYDVWFLWYFPLLYAAGKFVALLLLTLHWLDMYKSYPSPNVGPIPLCCLVAFCLLLSWYFSLRLTENKNDCPEGSSLYVCGKDDYHLSGLSPPIIFPN